MRRQRGDLVVSDGFVKNRQYLLIGLEVAFQVLAAAIFPLHYSREKERASRTFPGLILLETSGGDLRFAI